MSLTPEQLDERFERSVAFGERSVGGRTRNPASRAKKRGAFGVFGRIHRGRGIRGMAVANHLLTAGDVAELLGVAESWVREQSRRGRIPTIELGRYGRYRQEAIEAWLEEQESGNRPGQGDRVHNPR